MYQIGTAVLILSRKMVGPEHNFAVLEAGAASIVKSTVIYPRQLASMIQRNPWRIGTSEIDAMPSVPILDFQQILVLCTSTSEAC